MGFLENSITTIDAILTKKGRELMAQGKFDITQFALADDEIDYTMYNTTHPSGSAFYGEAINAMPLLQAIPDETQIMKYKLVTLPRGTSKLPVISTGYAAITLKQGASLVITPQTLNYLGSTSTVEPSGYLVTVGDSRLLSTFTGIGINNVNNTDSSLQFTQGGKLSKSQIGINFTLQGTTINTLFGTSNTSINTMIVCTGRDSGATINIPLTITKI